jgi:hypothetical protein
MVIAGELEGTRDPVTEQWKVPQHVVHARREECWPLEPARPAAQAQGPRACAGKGWGDARAPTARGNPRPARFLRGPIVRNADLRPRSARPLAHAAGHAIRLRRWRRGSPDPNREACRSLPGPLAGCTAEKAASIATPTSDRCCVGSPPLEVRWIRSAVPGWRWKQVRSG